MIKIYRAHFLTVQASCMGLTSPPPQHTHTHTHGFNKSTLSIPLSLEHFTQIDGVQKKKIYETSSIVANKKIMCRLSVCFRQKGAAVCQLALAVYFLYHLQSHRYGEARRQ